MKQRVRAFRLAAVAFGHPSAVTRLDRLIWRLGFKAQPTACWGYLHWFFVYWPIVMLSLAACAFLLDIPTRVIWPGIVLGSAILGMFLSVLQLRWIEKTGVDWHRVWESTKEPEQ